jgi:hypothetical protein
MRAQELRQLRFITPPNPGQAFGRRKPLFGILSTHASVRRRSYPKPAGFARVAIWCYNGIPLVYGPEERIMIKNLVKHGNSWALVIDRPILELLKIDPESPLEITTDGRSMLIAPAGGSDHQGRVAAARVRVNAKYAKAFKKLAE